MIPPHPPSVSSSQKTVLGGEQVPGASTARPKVAISIIKAALSAAGVPTAGLLERAEFEALYWKLKEEGGGGAGTGLFSPLSHNAAPPPHGRGQHMSVCSWR